MQIDSKKRADSSSDGAGFPALWPGLSRGSLSALTAATQLLSSPSTLHWFAHFGCALVLLPDPGSELDARPLQGQVQVLLVGLDEWTFSSHSHRCA